ncbi:hypothetical protein ACIHAR_29675 [Streptomyces sp. NPDC052016]|uniref:hypothetical protein n=1 Tax=Streptomyces sp. NPDC052016 TaxID=3365680 RepID=UPI0037D9324D
MAELVGGGKVTTVDIDFDVALHARTALNAAGYERVKHIAGHHAYARSLAELGRGFCPRCGSQLVSVAEGSDIIMVTAGRCD